MKTILNLSILTTLLVSCDQPVSSEKDGDRHGDCDALQLHGDGGDTSCDNEEGSTNEEAKPIDVDDETQQKIEDEIDDEFPDPPTSDCDGETEVSGEIGSDTTWNTPVRLTGDTTLASGVTLSLSDCGSITVNPGFTLTISGTLEATGTTDSYIRIGSSETDESWAGMVVASGGTIDLKFVFLEEAETAIDCQSGAANCLIVDSIIKNSPYIKFASTARIERSLIAGMQNKGVLINDGADVEIINSKLHKPIAGDVLGQNGGDLSIDRSAIGDTDYEHCAIHINAANSLSVTNSTLTANAYAIMLGNVNGAVFHNNNFMESSTKHFLKIGDHQNTDLTGNYWEGGVQESTGSDFDGTNSDLSNPVSDFIETASPDW